MLDLITLAGKIALPTTDKDPRSFWLGCIGIRRDGVLVFSKNGASHSTNTEEYMNMPTVHAEGRVLRKLGKGGTIYVARIAKGTKQLAMARPCQMCQTRLKAANIGKVYYSINDKQYGVWYPNNDTDRIFNT